MNIQADARFAQRYVRINTIFELFVVKAQKKEPANK